MAVRIEKDGPVWTVIHSRPEARNAMDPQSAEALYEAFHAFDADESADVAVFWGEGGAFCAGWDLKHAAALSGAGGPTETRAAGLRGSVRVGNSSQGRSSCLYLANCDLIASRP